MTTTKLCLALFFTFIITAGNLHAQQKNSVQGDFEALQALYNATQGSGIEVLNRVTELPAPENATYPFMYIIEGEIHALSKERQRGIGEWVNHGAIWKDKTGWDTMTPETMGDATGVTTDSNGRVIILDMQKVTTEPYGDTGSLTTGNGLIGTLPAEIGNLKKMQWFNIKQNFFHGEIPDVFDGWNDLERWSIGGINWEFNLDKTNEWHESDHLRVNYNDNPFTHSTVAKNIKATNNFKSRLPLSLDGLQNLELIEAAHQYLEGSLPEWANMSSILGIYIPDIRGDKSVTLGEIPESWGNLKTMQVFNISNYHTHSRFSGQLPDGMKDWTNLHNFTIVRNSFSGAFPQFTGLTDLVYFTINGMEFTGEFPWSAIFNGNNARLSKFGISYNSFSGSLPQSIPEATFPNNSYPNYRIDDFSIHGNNFDGDLPDWVSKFWGLQIINISYNNFTGSFPAELLNQGNLKTVFLQGNNLSGVLPEGTWSTDRIRWFRIDGNDFEGEIPEGWKSLFQENDLTTWNDGRYQRYRFENNNLSGRVPDWGKSVNWGSYEMYSFHNNKYTFKDILPVYDELKTHFGDNFKIDDQKPFGEPLTRSMPEGTQLLIDLSDVHYEGNSYQWTKDGAPLTGENSPILTISSLSSDNEGVYRLEVTNSSLPELGTHVSEPIMFELGADDGLNGGSDGGNTGDDTGSGDKNDGDEADGEDDKSDGTSGAFPNAPNPLTPGYGDDQISLTPVISWSSVEGADYYILHLDRNNPTGMVIDVMVEDTTYSHPEMLGDDAPHYWKVWAVKDGEMGEPSNVQMFRTKDAGLPEMAAPLLPENKSENNSLDLQFTWEDVDADQYQFRLLNKETSEQLVLDVVDEPSYNTAEILDKETEYFWQIMSIKDGVEGAWSPMWEFSTGAYNSNEGTVIVPTLVSPGNGMEYTTLQPTFEWANVEADHYILTVHKVDTVQAKSNTLLQIESSVIHAETIEPLFTPGEPLDPETDYYWKVQAVKDGVEGEWSEQWQFKTPAGKAVSVEPVDLAKHTTLRQNYPNPFNPNTQIAFTVANLENVSLNVYDMAGRQVAELVNGALRAGQHQVTFTADNLASGVYFYRLITGSAVLTKKMTLVK